MGKISAVLKVESDLKAPWDFPNNLYLGLKCVIY